MSIIMYKQRFAPPTNKFTPVKNYLHIGYIATRPRTMKNEDGVHGLFGYLSPTQPCAEMPWQETAKHIRQLSKENKNIYRAIISFNRADANELGLVKQKDWRAYAEQHIRTLAEKNKIDIANLGWCGAYHNEGDHPHLHIVFWDKAQEVMKNYVSPKIPNAIRIALIKSTFEDKIKALYAQKKLAKENIGGSYDNAVLDFDNHMKTMRAKNFKAVKSEFDTYEDGKPINITQLFNSDEQLATTAEQLFMLRNMIPKGGRVTYKLLPPEVKTEVDALTNTLIKNNTYLQTAVTQYIDSLCDLKRIYSSLNDPVKLKEYRDKSEAEAQKQIGQKIVKSIKAIISKEYEIKNADFTAARKQYYAMEFMREVLDFFARHIVANSSEGHEKQYKTFGDTSNRAAREWYLKNKDKGMEF
ncbi:MAG: relaxase MobL [Defluviitaleaceae bacterium]|nr:relaxase MobL [Defluviitaleaceae bacterium]MCL2275190.1 relaxase MobL [Defluviitaleaceae bacterium]